MCRSEAATLLSGKPADSKRPASSDSKASAPVVGESFDEFRKQDELYSKHELETGFCVEKIESAKIAFDKAAEILEAATKITKKN